jgi:membrane protease YdiL (CAAX protease family)
VLEPAQAPDRRVSLVRPVLPVQRLGAFVEVLLCSGFPSQLFLITVLTGLGMRVQTAEGQLSPPFIFTLSLVDTALVVGLVFFFLRAHRERARDVMLGQRRTLREVALGILLLPVIFFGVLALLFLILTYAPQLHNVPRNPLEDMLRNRQDALIFSMVVMLAGGLREEIQRAFILHRFEQYLGGGVVGILLYSGLFGLGHVEQGIDAAMITALLGAIWGAIYLTRRSIVAPMVSHAGFNLAQLIKYMMLR